MQPKPRIWLDLAIVLFVIWMLASLGSGLHAVSAHLQSPIANAAAALR